MAYRRVYGAEESDQVGDAFQKDEFYVHGRGRAEWRILGAVRDRL